MSIPVSNFIVLADDDKDHGVLFERILKQVDPSKKLSVVHDGEALLSLLTQVKPEILFLDLRMPCKNGLQCLQTIRNTPELKDLKVVVYSSSSHMSDIQRCYFNKADLYMVKPFLTNHLRSALDIILKPEAWQQAQLNNHYYINNKFVPFTAQV
jgi:CheY-like chemotaxis protein